MGNRITKGSELIVSFTERQRIWSLYLPPV